MSWGVIGPARALEAFRNGSVVVQPVGPLLWCRPSSEHGHTHPTETNESRPIHFQGYLHHLDALALSSPPQNKENLTAWTWQSYQQWGHELVLHLRGDYNAVIWDQSRQQVLAFTDPFGAKPLYYSIANSCFFYSSSLPKLLSLLPKRPSVHRPKLMEFLNSEFSNEGQSFYEGVYGLLPGQILRWSNMSGVSFQTCHPLEQPSPEFKHTKDEDWIEDFKERFSRSVQTRMKSEVNTACQLSGGLDSSSIVAMAQWKRQDPLKTLSWSFPNHPESDERPYIRSMVEHGHLDADTIETTDLDPFLAMDQWHQQTAEPSWFPNFYLHQPTYQRAQLHGSKQVLDGMDGDVVVSHGVDLPWRQFKRGHWLEMWQSLNALGATFDHPPSRLLKRLIIKPLVPDLYFRLKDGLTGTTRSSLIEGAPLMSEYPHFIQPHSSYPQGHAHNIIDPFNGHIMRAQQSIAGTQDLHISYPFFDVDLVQLCLNLPEKMICSRGFTRYVMRAAMGGHLPEDVRWRKKKSSLGYHLRQKFFVDHWQNIWDELHSLPTELQEIVDVEHVSKKWKLWQQRPDQGQLSAIWPVICLSRWLKSS